MCITQPTYRYEQIANNTALPGSLRTAAKQQLINDATFRTVVKAAEPATGPGKPTKDNKEFKCRIFSMGSSWPNKSNPLPGILVRDQASILATGSDGKGLEDNARERCFEGLQATYNLYKFFGRNSLDNQGKELVASIHIGIGEGDAYWNREQMIVGDGGSGRGITMPGAQIPEWLCSWYCCYDLDTIGHEITHGLVQETAGFRGNFQAETLNESIADCLGMMVKQMANNLMVNESDWDSSPGWWADTTVKEHGWTKNYLHTFRNPANKEAAFEPKHMNQWIETDDSHVNCGIPNHAFYLAALEFGGYSWKSVGRIWYQALIDLSFEKPEKQDFKLFARVTCQRAREYFGSTGEAILRQAWSKVGVI